MIDVLARCVADIPLDAAAHEDRPKFIDECNPKDCNDAPTPGQRLSLLNELEELMGLCYRFKLRTRSLLSRTTLRVPRPEG